MLKEQIKANVTYSKLTEHAQCYVNHYLNPNHSEDSQPAGIPDTSSIPFVFNKKTTSYVLNMKEFELIVGRCWDFQGEITPVKLNSVVVHSLNCLQYPIMLQTTFTVLADGGTYSAGFAIPDTNYSGDYINNNKISRFRYIGKGITIHNTTPKMYISGSTTSAQYIYDIGKDKDVTMYVGPRDENEVTTIKPYNQLDSADGAYIVLYNPAPLFYYHDSYNEEDSVTINRVRLMSNKGDGRIYDITKAINYNSNISIKLVKPNEGYTDSATCLPIDTTYGVWTIKQTQIVDFVLRFGSTLVPYTILPTIHDNQILELVQSFINEYHGMYPANWNSFGDLIGKIGNFIKKGDWIQPALGIANTIAPQLAPITNTVGNAAKMILDKINNTNNNNNNIKDDSNSMQLLPKRVIRKISNVKNRK